MKLKLMFLFCATALLFARNEQDDPLADIIVPEPAAAVAEKGAFVSEEEATAIGSTYFHMNWGWGGNHNGWFLYYDVNPDGDNYQNLRENYYVHP